MQVRFDLAIFKFSTLFVIAFGRTSNWPAGSKLRSVADVSMPKMRQDYVSGWIVPGIMADSENVLIY